MGPWRLASTLHSSETPWLLRGCKRLLDGMDSPSSQFGQINSPKRKTLGTSISLFKLPLEFSERRRKTKRSFPGKNWGEMPPGAPGPIRLGRPAYPVPGTGPVRFSVYRLFFAFSAHGKSCPSKSSRETPENLKKNYLQKYMPCFSS
jgi:hypothetical protein